MLTILLAAALTTAPSESLCTRIDADTVRCEEWRGGLLYVRIYDYGALVSTAWGDGSGTATADTDVVADVACPTVKPGPDWVCQGGGWLPPDHPGIPPAPAPPTPPAPVPPQGDQAPLVPNFQVGHTYRRDATGALIFITGLGVTKSGFAVLAAECLIESNQDQCFFPGEGRFILANASTSGWTDQP